MLYINDIEMIKIIEDFRSYFCKTENSATKFSDNELRAILEYYKEIDEEYTKDSIQSWKVFDNVIDIVDVYHKDLLPKNFDKMDLADKIEMCWHIVNLRYPVIIVDNDEEDCESFEHILIRVKN